MSIIDDLRTYWAGADVDDEDRKENEDQIAEWELHIRDLNAHEVWREMDVTKQMAAKARAVHLDCAIQLAKNRLLTEDQRKALHHKQDAALWVLSLTERDIETERASLNAAIERALSVTNSG